jgi:hypothetical protein
VAQLHEDVLEEAQRDLLGGRDALALDGPLVARGGQL